MAGMMLFSTSCGEFGDINIDPNNTTSVAPETLLTNALRSMSDVIGATTPVLYAQHMSETQYTESSLYQDVNFDFNGWYTGPLNDVQHIIQLNSSEDTQADALQSGSNANQIAVARILRAYFYQFMTDRWGDIPYSQALQGREDFTPVYDTQESIYKDLLKELKEAVAQMDGGPGVDGDFLFGGDMDQWKRFANTLRLVMAMRMSNVDAALANTEFNAALNAGIITDNVMYPYLNETNNQNLWFGRFITRTDYSISELLADELRNLNDPRLFSYGDEAPNFPGEVRGEPYGLLNGGAVADADISFPNSTYVRKQNAPIGIFTMAQVYFYRAEAAVRGWTTEDAQAMYEAGIAASWDQWGVFDQATLDTYLAGDAAYVAANAMELIGQQKWFALYLQGYEAWAEWRRTGYPALQPPADALNTSGQIPRRHAYPTSERDINGENYEAAVARQGADDLDTRLWWDK